MSLTNITELVKATGIGVFENEPPLLVDLNHLYGLGIEERGMDWDSVYMNQQAKLCLTIEDHTYSIWIKFTAVEYDRKVKFLMRRIIEQAGRYDKTLEV